MLEAGGPKRHAFEALLDALIRDPEFEVASTLAMLDEPVDVAAALQRVRERAADCNSNDPVVATRWSMGLVMRGLLGRVEPADVEAQIAAIWTEEVALA
jgi:hypothetical protein